MNRENDTDSGRAERALRRQNEYSATLHETALAMMHRLELADLLKAIVARAGALMGTPHGYVYLLEPGEAELEMRVGVGIYAEYVGYRLSPGEGLGGKVWESGWLLVVEDYAAWEGRSAKFDPDDFRAVAGVPLKSGSEVVGVLGLAYLAEDRTFGDDELALLSRFAELASIALDNARLYASAQQELRERERAERALGESEEQYRMLVETVQEGIGFVDAEERITYCNRAYAEIFELTPEELTGRSLLEFLDDEQRQKALEQTALRKTDVRSSYDITVTTGGGNRKHLSASGTPITDESGRFRGAVHAIIDVTERKRAEEALQASEERLRRLVEQAADALFVHDLEGRFVSVNRRACESLGYTREELLNLSVADVEEKFTPEGLSKLWEVIVAEGPLTLEGIHRRKDGTRFPVEVHVGPFETGKDRLMLAAARDVTERKEAEAALRESEARFRSLIQNSSDIITVVGADGTIRYQSPSMRRILGHDPEERTGKNIFCSSLVHPDDRAERKVIFERVTGSPGASARHEMRMRHQDGSWRHIEATTTNLLDDPSVGSIVINSRDVTERKRAEEALRESEERFRRLFEYSVDTLIVHDEEGRILDCNSEACRTLGYTHEELLSLRVQDIAGGLLSEEEKRERETRGHTLAASGSGGAGHVRDRPPRGAQAQGRHDLPDRSPCGRRRLRREAGNTRLPRHNRAQRGRTAFGRERAALQVSFRAQSGRRLLVRSGGQFSHRQCGLRRDIGVHGRGTSSDVLHAPYRPRRSGEDASTLRGGGQRGAADLRDRHNPQGRTPRRAERYESSYHRIR